MINISRPHNLFYQVAFDINIVTSKTITENVGTCGCGPFFANSMSMGNAEWKQKDNSSIIECLLDLRILASTNAILWLEAKPVVVHYKGKNHSCFAS